MASVDPTLSVYNERSRELADYFSGIGSRIKDINMAFELCGKDDDEAVVLELGCGDGRDAEVIAPRSKSYVGIDYSEGMLQIAKEKLPDVQFELCTMEDYEYPTEEFDIVFAFAAFLHLEKDKLQTVLDMIARTLRPGGILFLSTKFSDKYNREARLDKFGERVFYFYNPDLVREMTAGQFEVVETNRDSKGNTRHWFQMALRKN